MKTLRVQDLMQNVDYVVAALAGREQLIAGFDLTILATSIVIFLRVK